MQLSFIIISLLKQTLFLITPMDIDYSLVDLAGNGECNKPNTIFVACFSPKIWLTVQVLVICLPVCYCTKQVPTA